MVQRGYTGLGSQREAVRLFDELSTHVAAILAMQAGFPWGSAEHMAFGIALDGLETAAHHFTRRRRSAHAKPLADRRYAGPVAPSHRVVHDHDKR